MTSPVTFIKDVVQEVSRVVWPTPKTVVYHTVVVVLSMIAIIALMGGVDSLLVFIIKKTILKG